MIDVRAAAIAEIEELHVTFERWFSGETDSLERVEDVLSDGFTMVSPGGETVGRADLIAGLEKAHGVAPLSIEIRNPVVRWEGADALLVSYEEWQKTFDESNGRQSTVLFERNPSAPNGLTWVHVHESRMPAPATTRE
jgi:hypothetical protein